jgi:HJR/Mrr/RecB family endonuclease
MNSYFTNQAKTLASRNKVQLWDRKILVRNLLEIKNSEGTSKLRSGTE